VAKSFQYQFEWDPTKARQNVKKHGISFERAATVFRDPHALSELDEDLGKQEERWITLGLDLTGTLLVVCHTHHMDSEDSGTMRLISARKATSREAAQYRET
jgi:hypothetical protein